MEKPITQAEQLIEFVRAGHGPGELAVRGACVGDLSASRYEPRIVPLAGYADALTEINRAKVDHV